MLDDDESQEDATKPDELPQKMVTIPEGLVKLIYIQPNNVPNVEWPADTPSDFIRFHRVRIELNVQSDRGAAIIGGAYVEEALEEGLKRVLVDKTLRSRKDEKGKQLFTLLFDDYYGPLGAFSGKIRMAYALDLIGQHTYEDLSIIKGIRTTFAHVFYVEGRPGEGISFETQSIADQCNNLWMPKNVDFAKSEGFQKQAKLDTPRGRYIFSVFHISYLISMAASLKESIAASPHPTQNRQWLSQHLK